MADLMGQEVEIVDAEFDETDAAAQEAVAVLSDEATAQLPRGAELRADGTIMLTLGYPVTLKYRSPGVQAVREEAYEGLHFHRLTGADMRIVSQASADDRTVTIMARSAKIKLGLANALYDRMDGADINAVGQVIGFFLGSGPTTGR